MYICMASLWDKKAYCANQRVWMVFEYVDIYFIKMNVCFGIYILWYSYFDLRLFFGRVKIQDGRLPYKSTIIYLLVFHHLIIVFN